MICLVRTDFGERCSARLREVLDQNSGDYRRTNGSGTLSYVRFGLLESLYVRIHHPILTSLFWSPRKPLLYFCAVILAPVLSLCGCIIQVCFYLYIDYNLELQALQVSCVLDLGSDFRYVSSKRCLPSGFHFSMKQPPDTMLESFSGFNLMCTSLKVSWKLAWSSTASPAATPNVRWVISVGGHVDLKRKNE